MDVQKISQQVTMERWMETIRQCRESGMPVRHWCKLNDVKEATYYFWLKKIRTLACELIISVQ